MLTSLLGWQGQLWGQVTTEANVQTHPSVPPELSHCFCTILLTEERIKFSSIVPLLK